MAADRFSASGLDYATWTNKMVAEGKMYWPSNTTTRVIQTYQTTFTVKSVACGFVYGNAAEYDQGQTLFCNLVKQYVSLTLIAEEYLFRDGVCAGGENCELIFSLITDRAGAFAQNRIEAVCPSIYAAIYADCAGSTGGSAQISFTDSAGTYTGTAEGQFYTEDTGATCAADTSTSVCVSSSFN